MRLSVLRPPPPPLIPLSLFPARVWVQVAVREGLSESLCALYAGKGKGKAAKVPNDDESASSTSRHDAGRIVLRYKRYVYAPSRKLIQ